MIYRHLTEQSGHNYLNDTSSSGKGKLIYSEIMFEISYNKMHLEKMKN